MRRSQIIMSDNQFGEATRALTQRPSVGQVVTRRSGSPVPGDSRRRDPKGERKRNAATSPGDRREGLPGPKLVRRKTVYRVGLRENVGDRPLCPEFWMIASRATRWATSRARSWSIRMSGAKPSQLATSSQGASALVVSLRSSPSESHRCPSGTAQSPRGRRLLRLGKRHVAARQRLQRRVSQIFEIDAALLDRGRLSKPSRA